MVFNPFSTSACEALRWRIRGCVPNQRILFFFFFYRCTSPAQELGQQPAARNKPWFHDTAVCVASQPRNLHPTEQKALPHLCSVPGSRPCPSRLGRGDLSQHGPVGKALLSHHPGLNHPIAASLSTPRRDLATPRAINRAALSSKGPAPCRRVRESKANSPGR